SSNPAKIADRPAKRCVRRVTAAITVAFRRAGARALLWQPGIADAVARQHSRECAPSPRATRCASCAVTRVCVPPKRQDTRTVRACWLPIAVAGCTAQTSQPVMSNHAPGWEQHCAPLLESSVHADASGVDRLVARVDDDLRGCWKLAVRIVDAGRPVAPPPSCRALRASE